jgi:tetratricopeptide (TPR) repeat protein
MDPNAVEAHINLSTAYLKQNLPDLTIETCQQALQRFPNVALLHYNLACGYALKGRGAEAVDALERACNLDSRLRGLARDEPALESLHAHPLLSND